MACEQINSPTSAIFSAVRADLVGLPLPAHSVIADPVVGVMPMNLAVAPSFHREVIVVFSMRPVSLLRVCVRLAERLAAW